MRGQGVQRIPGGEIPTGELAAQHVVADDGVGAVAQLGVVQVRRCAQEVVRVHQQPLGVGQCVADAAGVEFRTDRSGFGAGDRDHGQRGGRRYRRLRGAQHRLVQVVSLVEDRARQNVNGHTDFHPILLVMKDVEVDAQTAVVHIDLADDAVFGDGGGVAAIVVRDLPYQPQIGKPGIPVPRLYRDRRLAVA